MEISTNYKPLTTPIPWKTELIEEHFGGGFSIRDVNDRLVWWESYLLPLRFIVRIINIIDIFERHPAPWRINRQPLIQWLSIVDINDCLVCWGDHLTLLRFVVGTVNSIAGLRVRVTNDPCSVSRDGYGMQSAVFYNERGSYRSIVKNELKNDFKNDIVQSIGVVKGL